MTARPVFEVFPDDMVAEEGSKVVLSVQVYASPKPTLTWYHDDNLVENDYAHEIASNGSLTIVTAELKHAGVYRLVARNNVGSAQRQLSLKLISEEPDEPSAAGTGTNTRPVPVAEFGRFVSQNHANSNKGFSSLFNVSTCAILQCDCVIKQVSSPSPSSPLIVGRQNTQQQWLSPQATSL